MDQENMISSLLELIERPAFCVRDGVITQVNQAARQLLISAGTDISQLLSADAQAYGAFQGETLTLTLSLSGTSREAQVSRVGACDIFVLSSDDPEMRAIALAAQNLRGPLNSVMTVAELLSCDDHKYMSQLQKSLNRMHRIVCNMSDAYRYQQAGAAHMEVTNLTSVFQESMEAIAAHLESCKIKVQYTGLNNPVFSLADREMLERAIYNLVSNAVKFLSGDKCLNAKLTQNGKLLSFTLQATTEQFRAATLFTSYQRQPGVEDSRHGIGLGMPLVRAVAAVHGGTVLVDHPDDQTTRITMTVSVTEASETIVRSSIRLPSSNYAGGRDRGLLELSEVLPADAYQNNH